jgi:predicted metalloprotease with PDZ domain
MRTHVNLGRLVCCAVVVWGTIVAISDVSGAPPRSQIAALAANVGLSLTSNRNGLVVTGVGQTAASAGFRVGDLVVAVNGQRVSTPRAFWARIAANQGGNVAVYRSGGLQMLTLQAAASGQTAAAGRAAPTTRSGGILNISQMVLTSQGIMHREAAIRLGLPYTPIPGAPNQSNF